MPNPLRGFRIKTDLLTEQIRDKVGKSAIESVRERIRDGQDVSDSAATPYSPYGPIYMPIGGAEHAYGRFKGRLGGVRYRLTKGYALSRRFTSSRNSAGGVIDGYSRTGRSLRFENYQQFKRYIGHSGDRDLEVTGKMLGSIAVTENQPDHVSIGFLDDAQMVKMKTNQKHSDQWGFSERNQDSIFKVFCDLVSSAADKLWGGK